MSEELSFNLIPRDGRSNYDWLNIECGTSRVGKVRGSIDSKTLTIFSINIFPEYERLGYAKRTMDMFKEHFDTIIADRVRRTAVGFWLKMGFVQRKDGNYIYYRSHL
ncbi:hypothetical protein ES708_18835 [subsurface metagenome]